MNTPALLPCPFCGATDDDLDCGIDEYYRAYVTCSTCIAEGPVVYDEEIGSDGGAAIEQAAAAWNQRSAWQPIETAPRDGTTILGWDGQDMAVVRWSVGCLEIWDLAVCGTYAIDGQWDPTHWQPLPSPPPITP